MLHTPDGVEWYIYGDDSITAGLIELSSVLHIQYHSSFPGWLALRFYQLMKT